MIQGTAYFFINAPIGSVSKKVFDFWFIGFSSLKFEQIPAINKQRDAKEAGFMHFGYTLFCSES